ncbi:hypothetical protein RD792_005968 [Penstemon davidsonii]|uniref:HAT C-terminal dimerisation domain-containing protein n=1 Tax=Penstemon davidsonii TaxID=160366 RepID=A0ABR0DDR8_9LAMI|nr:hypothetical protein RD792_005968 [Penstemon davidsonii]
MDMDDDDEGCSSLASQFARHLEENECVKTKSELTRYLEENCEKSVESFDLLRWWKEHSTRFPILSTLARDILVIPVSTVVPKELVDGVKVEEKSSLVYY